MDHPKSVSARKAVQATAGVGAGGTQSVDRAATLLILVGRAGPAGARLADLIVETDLTKPTVHRMLTALVRAGLLDQDPQTRRYHLGPELYVLGTLASARFGLHPVSMKSLVRLSQESGDTAFLSVAHDVYAICLHREDGPYPIRVHSLQAGDRHPLGIGAGSLALLSALSDAEIDQILDVNADVLTGKYEAFSGPTLRRLVQETRQRGYALNPGMLLTGSWGIGVAIRGEAGKPIGALSIAAIEGRLGENRQRELAQILRREARSIETRLHQLGRRS
ncbi:IclR family transcriptional regulator [Methylobacterium soli]|uniref:IclR family transcriptional regulator n=1 Tax=Methylobacterium soli TaxID=553447 RepID=A0A6L3T8T7_9HYPH|nr:IclR family transcriptional regulator [Methylobacterium soli]KAB1081877.1 IclR family transcriptional regulator [Methylobacterium soli]GJE42706.1 HTH-type transcriptional repressor AllR [Methylobacterium soli]